MSELSAVNHPPGTPTRPTLPSMDSKEARYYVVPQEQAACHISYKRGTPRAPASQQHIQVYAIEDQDTDSPREKGST